MLFAASKNMDSLIQVRDLVKVYSSGEVEVQALRGISLSIERGEFVAIMGASGSGKSTFMNIIGFLDQPTSGRYLLEGINGENLSRDKLAEIRNRKIGFVFQGFNLLSRTSALENVELPLTYAGTQISKRKEMTQKALSEVGLKGRGHHHPPDHGPKEIVWDAIPWNGEIDYGPGNGARSDEGCGESD